jgi:hypothetical protein
MKSTRRLGRPASEWGAIMVPLPSKLICYGRIRNDRRHRESTTTMNIPGVSTPVPVTSNPKAALALYDEKGQVSGVLDDDSISFFKSLFR